MKLKYIVLLFLYSLQITYSQDDKDSKIEKAYTDYFELPRETIYLHLNKTKYLQREKVWFTAYIYNRKTGLPFKDTKNLICGIYDEDGQQLNKEFFNVENGIASGYLNIESTFKSGNYYVKAATNYLKNFKKEKPYIQEIEVLASETSIASKSQNYSEIDSQFLPEGGYIVSGLKNTVGFKIIDIDAKGIAISNGRLVDSKDNVVISDIDSNIYGIGKFAFEQKSNETYYFQYKTVDGTQISKKLPEPKKKGITLTINNLFDDKLAIELRTNNETLPAIENKDLYLAIHRDGLLKLNTFKLNTTKKSIYISKDKLLPGINIITLFNADLKPILERLIFNETSIQIGKINTNLQKKNSQDSVRVQLNLFSKFNTPSNISISVLPEETMANENRKSIISHLLLKPYLNNEIENAGYYFRNINRKKQFELDMLLLTQGWSRYDWKDIFENPPEEKHKFDQGIQITGKVTNAEFNQQNQIVFYGKKTENMQFAEIDKLREFNLTTNIAIKNDSISMGLMNEKGKIEKPKLAEIVFSPSLQRDRLMPETISKEIGIVENSKISKTKVNLDTFYEGNIIDLESVTVTDNKIEKQLTRNPSLKSGIYEGVKVSLQDVKLKPTLTHFLTRLGFRIYTNPATGDGIILPKTRRPMVKPPKVVLDDFVVVDPVTGINNLPANILNSSTNLIDEVYYEHTGVEGSNGGTLYIYRRYGTSVTDEHKEVFIKMLVTEGFQRPTTYYNPKYSSYNSNDFLNYGVVHWENNLSTDTSGTTELNFPHFGLKNIKLFIEGMSQDGTLFSETKTISLN